MRVSLLSTMTALIWHTYCVVAPRPPLPPRVAASASLRAFCACTAPGPHCPVPVGFREKAKTASMNASAFQVSKTNDEQIARPHICPPVVPKGN